MKNYIQIQLCKELCLNRHSETSFGRVKKQLQKDYLQLLSATLSALTILNKPCFEIGFQNRRGTMVTISYGLDRNRDARWSYVHNVTCNSRFLSKCHLHRILIYIIMVWFKPHPSASSIGILQTR